MMLTFCNRDETPQANWELCLVLTYPNILYPFVPMVTPSPQALDALWYVVGQTNGVCAVCNGLEIRQYDPETTDELDSVESEGPPTIQFWGPFASRDEAIARRGSLIQMGRCNPQ